MRCLEGEEFLLLMGRCGDRYRLGGGSSCKQIGHVEWGGY